MIGSAITLAPSGSKCNAQMDPRALPDGTTTDECGRIAVTVDTGGLLIGPRFRCARCLCADRETKEAIVVAMYDAGVQTSSIAVRLEMLRKDVMRILQAASKTEIRTTIGRFAHYKAHAERSYQWRRGAAGGPK